jgi:4-hydroxyphenylpyruvate dioxygenase
MASVGEAKVLEVDEVNPMGTDGFEFVEYTAPDPAALGALFESMGFTKVARHRSKDVSLFRQGDVNFIVNGEKESFAQGFARVHGPSVCAIAFRVKNAGAAYKRALSLGAWGVEGKVGPMELNIPAIKGIGDSLLYLVDRYGDAARSTTSTSYRCRASSAIPGESGLTYLDHLTHNLHRGNMAEVGRLLRAHLQFPRDPLLRHRGQADRPRLEGHDQPVRQDPHPAQREPVTTRARSRNSSDYHGEGIQHIALGTTTSTTRVEALALGRPVPDRARHLFRRHRPALGGAWRGRAAPAEEPHPNRRRADTGAGPAAADLHRQPDRPDLLRAHPAQGQ